MRVTTPHVIFIVRLPATCMGFDWVDDVVVDEAISYV